MFLARLERIPYSNVVNWKYTSIALEKVLESSSDTQWVKIQKMFHLGRLHYLSSFKGYKSMFYEKISEHIFILFEIIIQNHL